MPSEAVGGIPPIALFCTVQNKQLVPIHTVVVLMRALSFCWCICSISLPGRFAVGHSGAAYASKSSPHTLCQLRFSSFRSDRAKPSTCLGSPRKSMLDTAMKDLYPIKCWWGVAPSRSNDGGLPKALSRRSQPFRLRGSTKTCRATEKSERLFLRECYFSS